VVDLRDDDARLVEAARAGDRGAFAAIFDRYAPRVHAFCTRLLNDPHTAADATQDTFVAAAQRLEQLRDPTALRSWLYAIARNECTRHGRARARAVPTEDSVMAGETAPDLSADEPATAAAAAEAGGILWEAADGLDEGDRILLELHVRHGLEGAELAEAAGVAPGQISMATGRMRERVARSVGALLIARRGRADCPGLQVVLADWDGAYTVLTRKRVARHIDRCERCDERRSALVAPFGALAVGPALATFTLPDGALAGMRSRVLDAFDRSGPGAGGSSSDEDPGAPTNGEGSRRRRRVAGAVAVVVLLLAAVIGALAARSDRAGESLATAEPDVPAAPVARSTSTTGLRSTSAPQAGATTTVAPAISPNQQGATTVPGQVVDPGGSGSGAPQTVPPSLGGPPVTLVPTTAAPAAPNQPPSIGSTVRSPAGSTMQTSCNPANATRTISVAVSDDRGVVGVVLRWAQTGGASGERAMTRSGGTWSAVLGPFSDPGTVAYRAVATDADGAAAASPTAWVGVDPCPG
jgi:RNA polymerase sigma factor (sigma-70 family)